MSAPKIVVQVVKAPIPKNYEQYIERNKKKFFQAATELIIADIIRGINSGVDATGSLFPALEPETVKRKGHSKPLIDKGLFRDNWTYQQVHKSRLNTSEITIKARNKGGDATRDRVGGWLQIDGLSTKRGRKRFYFFGITRDAETDVLELYSKFIQEALEKM